MNVISKYLQPAIDFMENSLQDGILSQEELDNFLTLVNTAKTNIDTAWPAYEQMINGLGLTKDSSNSLSDSNNIIADKINRIYNILNNGSSGRAWG